MILNAQCLNAQCLNAEMVASSMCNLKRLKDELEIILAKQPQDQIQTKHSHIRKMLKFKQQKKTRIIVVIKVTRKNNSLNNKITVKEKNFEMKHFF